MSLIDLTNAQFEGNVFISDIMTNFNKFLSTTTDPQNVKFGSAAVTGALTLIPSGSGVAANQIAALINGYTYIVDGGANTAVKLVRSDGSAILEANDNGHVYIPNGGLNVGTATGAGTGAINASGTINSTSFLRAYKAITDANAAILLDASNAKIEFGAGGASAVDTSLSRASANALQTGGSFTAVGIITAEATKRVACGGGSTGSTTTANGTVTLEINGTSYYLLKAAVA